MNEDYQKEIQLAKELNGTLKYQSGRMQKRHENMSYHEIEGYMDKIENFVANSKTFMNRGENTLSRAEMGVMRGIMLKNESQCQRACSLREDEKTNISRVVQKKGRPQGPATREKKQKVRNIVKYIQGIRRRRHGQSEQRKRSRESKKNEKARTKPRRQKTRKKRRREESEEGGKMDIKELIKYEEERTQKKKEKDKAVKQARKNITRNHEEKLATLIHNSKVNKNKLKKKISEFKVLFQKDRKKAEQELGQIRLRVNQLLGYCEKLRRVIHLNMRGEQAQRRPWSMYKPNATRESQRRPNSAVFWKQRVRLSRMLTAHEKHVINQKSIMEYIQKEANNQWVLESLKANLEKLQKSIDSGKHRAETTTQANAVLKEKIESETKSEDQSDKEESPESDDQQESNRTIDEFERKQRKEDRVRSEISKFNWSIGQMRLERGRDRSGLEDLKPFLSKEVKSNIDSWLHFEEKSRYQLKKDLQRKDEFELTQIKSELKQVQRFLKQRISRPQTAQEFIRAKHSKLRQSSQTRKPRSGWEQQSRFISDVRQIGKIRPSTGFPLNSTNYNQEEKRLKWRLLSGKLDSIAQNSEQLPMLESRALGTKAPTQKVKGIVSALPSGARKKCSSLGPKPKSSNWATLQRIRQMGRDSAVKEQCSKLTSGLFSRKMKMERRLSQFNNRVLSGYYQKTFKDAASTRMSSGVSKSNGQMGFMKERMRFGADPVVKKFENQAKVLMDLLNK